MNNSVYEAVLANYDRSPWVQIYAHAQSSRDFPEREEFVFLMREAEHCFRNGTPRASMVTAGEALQKVVLNIVRHHVIKVGSARIGGKLWGGRDIYSDKFFNKTTFHTLLEFLKEHNLVQADTLAEMFVVKDLRNAAAHGNWPVIDVWDPEVPDERFIDFLEDRYQLPEGYQVFLHGTRFQFGCAEYGCGPITELHWLDRLAAVQFFVVNHVLKRLLATGIATPTARVDPILKYQVWYKTDETPGSSWEGPVQAASVDEGVSMILERGPRCSEAVVTDAGDMPMARAENGVLVFRLYDNGEALIDGRVIDLRKPENEQT